MVRVETEKSEMGFGTIFGVRSDRIKWWFGHMAENKAGEHF